jgi:hypothetical protein
MVDEVDWMIEAMEFGVRVEATHWKHDQNHDAGHETKISVPYAEQQWYYPKDDRRVTRPQDDRRQE